MKYHVFQYPLPGADDLGDLNACLARERVASVRHHIVDGADGPLLVFVVQTVDSRKGGDSRKPGGRVDYRAILSPEDFVVYSRLRETRKELASADSIPVYTVFSNEQLAAIARMRPTRPNDLEAIEGVGEARIERFGARMIESVQSNSEGGQVD